jgi:hypothetical protein
MIRLRKLTPFWALQLVGWPAYGLISLVGALPYIGLVPHLNSLKSAFFGKAAFVVAGILCSGVMRFFYRRESMRGFAWLRMAVVAIVLSYSAGLVATIVSNAARQTAGGKPFAGGWSQFFGGAVNASAVFLAWSACYLAVRTLQALEKEKRDALRANVLAHQAQLEALRSQVNPHFLFNALNSIHALVRDNPTQAQFAVEELSEFLRYSLATGKALDVPLSEEIGILERYLGIERIRFEEKLHVRIDVLPEVRDVHVPGFLLHPLIENAIKFGMKTSAMPLQIRLSAVRSASSLRLSVANTGHWVAPPDVLPVGSRAGLGMQIVAQRLEQAFPGQHHFECRERDGWVENVIEIQLACAGVV